MAEIFDFYVNDNRSITFKLSEPIMLEDNGVSDWRFHIPNIINGLDATGWQWWLVYVNAKGVKYTIPLTLEYDYDRPDAYSIATYTVDYGMSCKVGSIKFSIEAIDTDTGGTILHEWHTKTYSATVEDTLQGNQVEYAETESDIISALLIEVRNKVNQLVGGATPLPVASVSEMTDTGKVYLLTTDANWYYHKGTTWVSGGVYGAGITDAIPTQGSTNAVQSGGVYSALHDTDTTLSQIGQAADAKKTGDEITSLKEGFKELPSVKESDAENVSLDISDKDGYVVMRLADGEIKTKNFDSTNVNADIAGLKTGKVNMAQGAENSGKILSVGSDGNIALINPREQAETPVIETFSTTASFTTGTALNITISNTFNKGDRVLFHVEDGYKNYEAGALATYYENGRKIVESRRGSNGYYEYVVTSDDATLSIRIPASGYSDNRQVTLFVYRINGEVNPKVVTVDANGNGMFTTLRGAIDSITDANAYTNPYVIEVYPGTYDVLADYTDAEIADVVVPYTQTSFVGPKLTDGISIKGVGGTRDDIILTANLDPDKWESNVRGQVSTLNLQGSGSMENLTVIAYNIRYCVHDDFRNPSNQKTFRRLKNLKFGGSLTNNPKFSTYGAGMSTPRDYIIEDCDFGYVLGIHGNTNYSFPCHIKLDNCSGYAFVVGDYADEDTDAVINVEVNNCNFERIYINRHTVLTKPHVRLYGAGNDQSMVVADSIYPYYFGNVLLAESGFDVGSVVAHRANDDMFDLTGNADIMCGVVVYADSDYSYVVRNGYIQADRIGLTGLAIGDYVTIDGTTKKVASGGTSANAIGVVTAVDATGSAFIRLRG